MKKSKKLKNQKKRMKKATWTKVTMTKLQRLREKKQLKKRNNEAIYMIKTRRDFATFFMIVLSMMPEKLILLFFKCFNYYITEKH